MSRSLFSLQKSQFPAVFRRGFETTYRALSMNFPISHHRGEFHAIFKIQSKGEN
jgi:hypothetical protein